MPARILYGQPVAEALLDAIKQAAKTLKPSLAIVQVGDDPASNAYIRRKIEACAQIGIRTDQLRLPTETSLPKLLKALQSLNSRDDVSCILVQLPLPEHLWQHRAELFGSIDPRKDVDGLTPQNIGNMLLSPAQAALSPATPSGIVTLLDHYTIPIAGKHAVIVGRSTIVGKPLAGLLLDRDATVTLCHRKTADLRSHTLQADLLISATGTPRLITADMVKQGATVIDVGITRTDEGLVGDVDFEAVKEKAAAITPVPGGVGPLTVACLLRNCVRAKETQQKDSNDSKDARDSND